MAKTKDIFLNIAANPNMTLEDLASVGLTSDNTMLLDRASYASNEKVQNMFKDSEGNFDEQKFNAFYDIAEQSYNVLANDEVNLNLMDVTAYDADNIFVDPSKRRYKNEPLAIKLPNPDRLNTGLTRIGKVGPRLLSQDEIAQTQKVLVNPVGVANGEKPIYSDSPNDSWFTDFWDTRVMAAWDEDGTHVDPVTGQEVQHKKGDLKLNENGTYYYENLDGRSVYGKRVLNKFNTLTTDGSAWNKYDFFDSDSIEQKSIGGSIAKNLALVGSMFIPYVGWGVAAASVAHQSAGLFATLGKMLAGSDSPTLDAIEGWVKSTDRRNLKTEYAQQNMWCWENFIDLIGDTTAQLREQRAIFKFAPGLIKGDFKALSEKAMKEYTEKLAKEGLENASKLSFNDLAKLAYKQNPGQWKAQLGNLTAGAKDIYMAKAQKAARDYLTSYYKLGEPIAKAYMTAITVQDTFGEAIEAGASDSEATLLTLGYAAAEAALLSTDLGKWIMPELRSERQRYKMLAKKLMELPQETREMSKQLSRLGDETKKDWAKRLFNIGKDIATAEYSVMAKTAGSVLASGLGEGVEEVSEELLADFSKSCFNLVQKLQGDDVRMSAWENMGNRYAMSFAGGILGGGINAAASDYKANHDLLNMNSQQALQQIIYMTRNDEMEDFWKVVDKTELASKNLSTKLNESGTGYKEGTKEDNQDLEAKRALKKQISMIESIINAENAKLNDSGLLSVLIKADPSLKDLDPVKEYRMRALANSATAGRFLNEFNTISTDIVKNRLEQNKIMAKYGDTSSEKYSEEDKQTLKKLGQDLKTLQERKNAMLEGGRTREYVRDALFEMTHAVKDVWDDWATEIRYAEAKTGKKYVDISEEEKKELKEQYITLKSSNQYAEQIHELANIYETLAISASNGILASAQYLEGLRKGQYDNIHRLDRWASARLSGIQEMLANPEKGVAFLQGYLDEGTSEDMLTFEDSSTVRNKMVEYASLAEAGTPVDPLVIAKTMVDGTYDKLLHTCDEILKAGFIHPETKALLSNMINRFDVYVADIDDGYMGDMGKVKPYSDKADILQNKLEQIDQLSNTPILENLKQFQLSTTVDQSVLDLVTFLIQKESAEKSDISTFQLDKFTTDQFKEARKLLELYRSAIVGARVDNVDLDTIVGFNATLNEVSGPNETPKLAEIDAQTADLIMADIDTVLKRLDYAEGLHNLNTGNKYNVQAKTAINKQFILHNKLKTFVSILDDDDWEGKDELKAALEGDLLLNRKTGKTYNERTFTLTPQEKTQLEEESIRIQTKLHEFLVKNIDGSEASVKKLAKLLTYDNFKGLIRENNDFLESTSEDIDDSAFIWWLCATAALNPHQFYNNYRKIIGEEIDGEKPIAPIPTQELGVFALTAAVVNGDMFKVFGKALRQSLLETWNKDKETREKIKKEYGSNIFSEEDALFFKNADFLPNFDNIIFVEGIAGSGKSTGVLKAWSRLLAKTNPDFVGQKILFAHTDKTKAENLAKSTAFTNFEAHDKNSLLSYMSGDYAPVSTVDGNATYILGKDVILQDGLLQGPWKIKALDKTDVPKTIVIDEWTHYNQLEQDLIQRFAQAYGVTVITMGDYDQLTPTAKIKRKESDPDTKAIDITPVRMMTPRVAKLGVSMRTDNEIKNGNMYRMLAWRRNPTNEAIDLHYYEDETGIYGDKNYTLSELKPEHLEAIKLDVKKMISTLKPDEKIGYIYHDVNSELYKWLTTQEGVKEHIQPYLEKDAHGREAQYYIVENNRGAQDALDYFRAVYTGITRSEQGSIVITGSGVKENFDDKYNKAGLGFKTIRDDEMQPNTYTEQGTREFSRKRKESLDSIFGNEEFTPFEIKPRTTTDVVIKPDTDTFEPSDMPQVEDPSEVTPEPSTPPGSEVTPEVTPEEKPSPERTDEDEDDSWKGKFKKGQVIYTKNAEGWMILNEVLSDPTTPKYMMQSLLNNNIVIQSQGDVNNAAFEKLPEALKYVQSGDLVNIDGETKTVESVALIGDSTNPMWQYTIDGVKYSHDEIKAKKKDGSFSYVVEETIPDTPYNMGSREDFEEAVDEQMDKLSEDHIQLQQVGDDISFNFLGFTFNNLYLADEFKDGELVPLPEGNERIDNGYGLYKINPNVYKYKSQIEEDLCKIRRQLEFGTNQEIVDCIQNILQLPEYEGLTIRWAFISKVDGKYLNGKYTRFQKPEARLEYMRKDDSDTMRKTLSAVIYDRNGNAILELPIITLQSPHSIFNALKDANIASDITDKWTFDEKEEQQTLYELLDILKVIDAKDPSLEGYKRLGTMIRLWLFTSSGVKVLPSDWNLSREVDNLGNLYITRRTSDNYTNHDFHGYWDDIRNLERKDRFISNIYMNKSDQYVLPSENRVVSIIPAYTPYVFISDDPTINSDEAAARQYLKQQSDPNEPKKVIAVMVSPPETSVSNYIDSMHKLITGQSTNEPYGSTYTPIRIWQAILRDGRASNVMASLGERYKNIVMEYIPKITEIEQQNPIMDGETKVAYRKRIANKLVPVLNQRKTIGRSEVSIAEVLRKALVECVYYEQFNPTDDSNTGNREVMRLIQQICDDAEITGALCKPRFTNVESNLTVGGFAIQVKTQDKYDYPGVGSYRVFGKIDPPTYILNSMFEHINKWMSDYAIGVDPKTGRKLPDNVWKFIHDDADLYYLPKESNKSINLTPIIEKANNFIARLGISEYNIQTSDLQDCTTELEAKERATELIEKKFLENNGAFIIKVNGVRKYGNIIDPRTPEFQNYKFDNYTTIDGKHILRFMDLSTNTMQEIEIELDPTSDSFKLVPMSNSEAVGQSSTIDVKTIKQQVIEELSSPIITADPLWSNIAKQVLPYYNEEANTIDVESIRTILNNANLDPIALMLFESTLQLDNITAIEPKQAEDLCINPIKIKFK